MIHAPHRYLYALRQVNAKYPVSRLLPWAPMSAMSGCGLSAVESLARSRDDAAVNHWCRVAHRQPESTSHQSPVTCILKPSSGPTVVILNLSPFSPSVSLPSRQLSRTLSLASFREAVTSEPPSVSAAASIVYPSFPFRPYPCIVVVCHHLPHSPSLATLPHHSLTTLPHSPLTPCRPPSPFPLAPRLRPPTTLTRAPALLPTVPTRARLRPRLPPARARPCTPAAKAS